MSSATSPGTHQFPRYPKITVVGLWGFGATKLIKNSLQEYRFRNPTSGNRATKGKNTRNRSFPFILSGRYWGGNGYLYVLALCQRDSINDGVSWVSGWMISFERLCPMQMAFSLTHPTTVYPSNPNASNAGAIFPGSITKQLRHHLHRPTWAEALGSVRSVRTLSRCRGVRRC
jgi:hypothetical protein